MSFVTKAVIATGATAIVALGGAGVITNLTSTVAAAQAPSIVATGHIAATGATCTPWALSGGDFVEQATPGTTVSSTCTVNIAGGDTETQAYVALADGFDTPDSVKKVFSVKADVAQLFDTGSGANGSDPLVVTVTARIPNADQANISNENAAKDLTEALSNVVVTFDAPTYLGIPAVN